MPLLEAKRVTAFYGKFQALFDISLDVEEGETVAIIGANGAGKSTFLKVLAGLIPASKDSIQFRGAPIGELSPAQLLKLGIAMAPEGRRLFRSLTVEENLLVGGDFKKADQSHNLAEVYALFPVLAERRRAPATALSGGEQQMAAIGRALMSRPRLLLCDELSLGLAPKVIGDIYAALPNIKARGTTPIIVEQDIGQAMSVADRVYCFQEGRVRLSGRPRDLTRDAIVAAYFGMGSPC